MTLRIPPRNSADSYPEDGSLGVVFLTEQDVIAHIEGYCKGKTKKSVAAELGISPQYLTDILQGRREISYRIAKACGLVKCVLFEHPTE